MRATSSTRSALPSTSRRQDGGCDARRLRASKPSVVRIVRMRARPAGRGRRAARHRPDRSRSAAGGAGELAGQHDLRGLAAAELQDQPRRQLQPGDHEARIDAAGEAVLGVGDRCQVAAGLGGADRIEPGALDEDLGGGLRAAGGLAAHHAAQADGARAVGDDAHLGRHLVGLAVERRDALRRSRPSRASMKPPVSLAAS